MDVWPATCRSGSCGRWRSWPLWAFAAGAAVGLVGSCSSRRPLSPAATRYVYGHPAPFLHFELARTLRDPRSHIHDIWFGLPEMSGLSDDLTVAATEVGAIAALNPGRRIIDLSGLNDPWIVRHDFSAAQAVAHYKPDLIYMPHRDYRAMTRELLADPYFYRITSISPDAELGTRLGLALRRDSPYFARMLAVVTARTNAARAPDHDSGR